MLENKTVLITGGARGIGAGIVRRAMEEGAQVAFTYLTSGRDAGILSQEMMAQYPGQNCLALQCDATDTEAMQAMAQKVLAEFGRLDVLVNNAGIAADAALARMTRDQWDRVITTNLSSVFNATKPLVLPMIKQGCGSIVNLTSSVAIYGNGGQANYAAAKAGIIGFTKALSVELGPHGIRVNAVAPSFILTDMTSAMNQDHLNYLKTRISLGRWGTIDDVAPVICFLASDLAGYITGQVIQVDGGIIL